MSYNGFEVFFLFLNNADSILIRHYSDGIKTVILIDAGRRKHTEIVRRFLHNQGESHINHLICSHAHEDHAAGLIGLVEDTTLQIDKAWVHAGDLMVDRIDKSHYQAFGKLLERAKASKEIQHELITALLRRKIPTEEPFAVKQAGPLFIVSPTVEFYSAQLNLIRQENIAKALNDRYVARELREYLESYLGTHYNTASTSEDDGELGGEPTSPENEVSVVGFLPWQKTDGQSQNFLLTADAGTVALTALRTLSAGNNHLLQNLSWMQLPHHGSRRNLNTELITYFKPSTAFVSAEGSKKHPSTKLVNAVKECGGKVYGTYYPPEKSEGSWLRQTVGNVPLLSTSPAKPLWES